MAIYLSQQGEDIYTFLNFINKPCEDGVFLELGGCDGLLYSNTFFFENTLKFKGVLIEPQRGMFDNLIKNRPRCICLNNAVSNISGDVTFIGANPTAGILDLMSEKHKNHWHKSSSTYTVKSKRLADILTENSISYIDFFTLDVEGGEKEVLETIDWKTVEIYIICIELSNGDLEREEACRKILRDHGFVLDKRFCINDSV